MLSVLSFKNGRKETLIDFAGLASVGIFESSILKYHCGGHSLFKDSQLKANIPSSKIAKRKMSLFFIVIFRLYEQSCPIHSVYRIRHFSYFKKNGTEVVLKHTISSMKITCFVSVFLLFSQFCVSQNDNRDLSPFATSGYGGIYVYKPNFTKKGMEYVGNPAGIELNLNGANFTMLKGQVRPIGGDSSQSNTNFVLTKVGFQVGKEFKLGAESYRSVSIKPFVNVGATVGAFSKIRIDSDLSSIGLFVAPGISAQFSQLYFTAQYEGMMLGNMSLMKDRKQNFGRGFFGGFSYSIGISTSFDLLTPEAYSFRGLDVDVDIDEKSWDEYRQRYGKYYKYRVTQTTTTTTKTPGLRTLTLVKPFFGVGPAYTFNYAHDRSAISSMKGANFGIRAWYLMLDAFYETGQYGLKDPAGWENIVQSYPIESDFDFSYSVPVVNYGYRLGFNIAKFFTLNDHFEIHDDSKTAAWYVPFTRVNLFLVHGKTVVTPTPTFTNAKAAARIDAFYDPQNSVNQDFHPSNLPSSAIFFGWGASIELGAFFVNMTNFKYKSAPLMNNRIYTIGANIPIGRVLGSEIAHYKIRKEWKKKKGK